ncbi:MAG: hypothetical protein HZC13_00105 [Nitrospirae bacterium]|nr:hypothetical protein [Nitrospirota bacterium]MBI5097173.1 hypothetical protein [Nitrospirota bacterium]
MIGYNIVAHAEDLGHHHHVTEAIDLNLLSSYTGGVHNLFSIWFFCLLQISPFFLAFLLGIASIDPQKGGWQGIRKVFLAGVLALAGFSVIFTIIGASAASPAVILYRYLSLLNQLGGVLILLMGLFFLGVFTLPANPEKGPLWTALSSIGPVLFGMALAFAYKPCVTPTLSEIFNYTKDPQKVSEGAGFLIAYSAGVSTSLLSVGTLLSSFVLLSKNRGVRKGIRILSGVLLIMMGIMILTDWMVAYKSLLVGRLVP